MIKIRELNSAKKEIALRSLEEWTVGKTLSWVNCINPTQRELKEISLKTGIALEDLEDSVHPNKRPHVIPYRNYSLIIFKTPYREGRAIKTASLGIFLFKKDVITICSRPIPALQHFDELPESQQILIFKNGAPYFVYRLLDHSLGDFFEMMDMVSDEIDLIEWQVLHHVQKVIPKEIFAQKRVLIYLHKALIANRDVISALEKHYLVEFTEDSFGVLRNLYNDTAQLIDLVTTYRDTLSNVLDMYLSSINNNLNNIMKTLTIISAFVLVPMFIASIYGMNFGGESAWNMPELYWKYGYEFALGLMALSVVVIYGFFKRKKWI